MPEPASEALTRPGFAAEGNSAFCFGIFKNLMESAFAD
jgi:hypothetical protein